MIEFLPLVEWFDPGDMFGSELFQGLFLYIFYWIVLGFFIGLASRKAAMGIFGGFLFFVHYAVETNEGLFITITYVVLTFVVVVMCMRVALFVIKPGGSGGGRFEEETS